MLFFVPFLGKAQQVNRDQWGNQVFASDTWQGWCEYLTTYWHRVDSTWWAGGNDLTLRGLNGAPAPQAVPTKVPVPGVTFIQLSNALHDDIAVSSIADTSFAYIIGANNYGQWGTGNTTGNNKFFKIRLDSAGNLLDSLRIVAGGWYAVAGGQFYIAVKNNGSVWGWGNMNGGGAGNGSAGSALRKPAQIFLSGGKSAQFVQCAEQVVILCTDSTVQTFQNDAGDANNLGRVISGTNNRTPIDIGLHGIVGISVGYAVSYAWDINGDVWAWGKFCKSYGGQNHITDNGSSNVPIKITSLLALPAPVRKIVCNHNATVALLTNGKIYGWGGIPTGATGVNQDFFWPSYTGTSGTSPYNGGTPDPWNWHVEYAIGADLGDYVVATPQQIAPGKSNFANIFGGSMWDFDFSAVDSTQQFYQWGRGKGAVIANGTYAADSAGTHIEASYHVSWDQPLPVLVTPFNVTVFQEVTSPFCVLNPATFPCSNYTIPTRTHPHSAVTSYTTTIGPAVLDGRSSTAFYFNNRLWTQLSGAAVPMGIRTSPTDSIVFTTAGTYTFKYRITDDVWQSDSAVATIIVTSGAAQTHFYVSSSTGSNVGSCGLLSPCATVAYIHSLGLLVPGDTVSLKGGDTFNETIYPSTSGTASLPIVYNTYGTGQAIVSGFALVNSWTSYGSNTYAGICPKCKVTTNLATVDGKVYHLARFPNAGYLKVTAITSTSATVPSLTGTPSYTGKMGVFKVERFSIDSIRVNSQVTTTLNLASAPSYTNGNGNGMFFENDRSFLDTAGEYQVVGVDTLLIVSLDPASNHIVNVAGSDTGVYLSGKNYLTFSNWKVIGQNQFAFFMNVDTGIVLNNCNISQQGNEGILDNQVVNLTLNTDTLEWANDDAIYSTGGNANHHSLINSVVKYNGLFPGMGKSGGGSHYEGVNDPIPFSTYSGNDIDSNGYVGLHPAGDSLNIFNNHVHRNGQVKSDGSEIYLQDATPISYTYGRNIFNNILDHGFKDSSGVKFDSTDVWFGLYIDAAASGVNAHDNTGNDEPTAGLFNHGANNTYLNNNWYGNGFRAAMIAESSPNVITGIVYEFNSHGSPLTGTNSLSFTSSSNDLGTFCTTCDNNYYIVPLGVTTSLYTKSPADAGTLRNLTSWQTALGIDLNSSFISAPTLFKASIPGGTFTFPGQYKLGTGTIFNGKIVLQPYSSVVTYITNYGFISGINVGKFIVLP